MVPKPTRIGMLTLIAGTLALAGAAAPAQAGEFFEGFEDGTLGAMVPMNLDAGLYSAEASDGYRCQYNDPDYINSNSYEPTSAGPGKKPASVNTDCWVGATEEQGNAFFWNVVDGFGSSPEGRSYRGRYSVWMGALLTPTTGKDRTAAITAPLATLEGIAMASPVQIASEGTVELSFKHQISLPDYRYVNAPEGRSSDGGVVQAQVVDAAGSPLGVWTNLAPFQNGYDLQRADNYVNCMFDPIDDGNTEDDFYEPYNPELPLGPSSLCYDQWVFTALGDTDEPFDALNVNHAAGPGLQGATGIGTWVESRCDLSAYRGQYIRIRFITTGIKVETVETYEELMGWNPTPADDGWFIDDIRVTGTVEPASVEEGVSVTAPSVRDVKFLQARPTP